MVPCCLVTLSGGGAEAKLDLEPDLEPDLLLQLKAPGAEQPSPCCSSFPENRLPLSFPLLQNTPWDPFPHAAVVVEAEFHIIDHLKVAWRRSTA